MSDVTTISIDLAKNVFQVHGVDSRGKAVFRKPFRRQPMAEFFANRPSALIGMEACASAHYWARKLEHFAYLPNQVYPACLNQIQTLGRVELRQRLGDAGPQRRLGTHRGSPQQRFERPCTHALNLGVVPICLIDT